MRPTAVPAADAAAVDALQAAYADLVNRRAWAELEWWFRPDARVRLDLVDRPVVEVTGPAAFAAFVGPAVERFDFFEFVRLTSHLSADPGGDRDRLTARLWMCEVRHEAAGDRWSTAFGLYRDTYTRVEGRWWFAGRHYRSLARTGPGGAVLPFPVDPGGGDGSA